MKKQTNDLREKAQLEIAAHRAALPFSILEDLNVPCGYERSFKMIPGKLLANRYLLGVKMELLSPETLLDICRQLSMPAEYQQLVNANCADANLVFLGFEDNEPGCTYKIYLEFWDKVTADILIEPNRSEPALLHLGFKWSIDDNTQQTVARYTCYPLLSVEETLNRLSRLYEGHDNSFSLQATREIIQLAAGRVEEHSFIYLEVEEEDNPRRSFDLNLYKAQLHVTEIEPSLSTICLNFGIPAELFQRLDRIVGGKLLGHISGGRNQQQRDFLTVYFEA